MTGETFAVLAGGISGTLTSCGALIGIPVFFYRRGKADQRLIESLQAITRANEQLSTRYETFEAKAVETFHNHDLRIARLEPFEYNGRGKRR